MAKKFLSREEYLDKQRQAIIDKSIENSNNRILPTVPYIPRESKEQWYNRITSTINDFEGAIRNGKDKLDEETLNLYSQSLDSLKKELNAGYGNTTLCAGDSCIYTATDNYGKKYRISGNQSFRANPAKYGFEEINLNNIKPGDIIQDFSLRDNTPHHAITFIGYDDNNKALFNYSKGGSTEKDIVKNGYYPFYWDDETGKVHLDGTNNDKLRHVAAAYRFIGTEDYNKLWNENYNKERSDWSKQAVEELRKVPTLTLPNKVQMMKFGGMKQDKVFKLKGGVAIPLDDKKRLFYLSGAKHEQGGIDITPELEAEGGEVVKINPKSIKVVTAQKIMGGKSPAELVVDASSTGKSEKVFNKVFNYQEDFKDRHKLNDDGTKKAKWGKIIEYIKNKGKELNRTLRGEFMDFAQSSQHDDESNFGLTPSVEGERDYKNNIYPDPSQTAYLFNKEDHKNAMLNSGYIEGVAGDYGLVKSAVGDRNLPVYQKRKDDEYVGNLHAIANPHIFYKDNRLEHAGDYPTALYVDDAGNVFQKGWDLHDYGEDAKGNKGVVYKGIKQHAANLLDKLGNPFVRTTGLTKLNDSDIQTILIGDTNKNLVKDILKSKNKTLLNHYNKFKNNRLNSMYKSAIEDEYYKYNDTFDEAKFEEFKKQYPYSKFINELDKYYTKDELETLKIFKYGGDMKIKKKADLGIQETLNKFGQHYLYPSITPAIIVANDPNKKSVGETIDEYSRHYLYQPEFQRETPAVTAERIKKDNSPIINFNSEYLWQPPASTRGNVPIPYRLEEETITPMQQSVESQPQMPLETNYKSTTNTTTKTPVQTNFNNIKKPSLNLDFLYKITNRDGSTYNFRTEQTEHTGFINPYSSKIQSTINNNGTQGTQEGTTKEGILNTGDWINIGSNALGAIGNLTIGFLTPDIKYARMKDPIAAIAPKINSNVNTTAEENAVNEAYNDEIRSINENTADSKTALFRKRNAALRNRQAKVKIRANAENTRRVLINEDNKLRAEYDKYNLARQENVDAYNAQARVAEFNANKDKEYNAVTGFLNDLISSTSTITNAIEKRKADRINTALTYLGNPNVDPTKFNEALDIVNSILYPSKSKNKNKSKKNNTQS